MKIRKGQKEDISACYDVYSYYVNNSLFSLDTEPPEYEKYYEKLERIREDFPFLVCEENEKIIGFAYLDCFNIKKGYDKTADLTLYFLPDSSRKGYGTMLLKEIEKEGKIYGKVTIISLVTDKNEASYNFHIKNGFIVQGQFPNIAYKNGQSIGLIMLRKDI